jgi:ABC-type transport system involved in multi-copper enzyme maturation permease subunit
MVEDSSVLIGPVFTRELAIAPRRARFYVARALYVLALLILAGTAWLIVTGTQVIRDVGDMAQFGAILFQLLAALQLALGVFFAATLAASGAAQEKDRRTMVLLLLTNLTNSELVLGRLLASLLGVFTLLAAAFPLFMLCTLFGGVAPAQVVRVFAVTLLSVLACGSLGSTLALWREKTFQTLAMTVLVLVLWLGGWEGVAAGALGDRWLGISTQSWAIGFSPWQAILEAALPFAHHDPALGFLGSPLNLFYLLAAILTLMLNGVAVVRVRGWNTVGEDQPAATEAEQASGKRRQARIPASRQVWDNPVVWREIRTWAYGRKMLLIRLAYLALFALAVGNFVFRVQPDPAATRSDVLAAVVPLLLLSLVLVNAQAVTSLTSERDARALDLLLVTDLTPLEIVFGKLGGVFYNTKEMVLLPMALCVYLAGAGFLGLEDLCYVLLGLAVLYLFAATLGIHAGITYPNSRSAIATSLGTMFFLFLGIATCMRMMISFSGSFQAQLQPFLAFMIGGGIGLYAALGARNPSTAIGLASFACPFATFYAIASFWLNYTLSVFLVTVAAYGFATAAMLVPAIYEFDVATGRTTIGEE